MLISNFSLNTADYGNCNIEPIIENYSSSLHAMRLKSLLTCVGKAEHMDVFELKN